MPRTEKIICHPRRKQYVTQNVDMQSSRESKRGALLNNMATGAATNDHVLSKWRIPRHHPTPFALDVAVFLPMSPAGPSLRAVPLAKAHKKTDSTAKS